MIVLAMLLMAEAAAAAPVKADDESSITIEIANVRNSQGRVRVDVCPRKYFLANGCPWHANVPAQPGVTKITMTGVPPGDYAVQAFHDENNNGRVDRGMFGIPKEGVGFSRDARIMFGPPKWEDAVFTHGATAQTIRFSLRYFTGPGSPEAWRKRNPG